jgi:CRISPR-associated endoribonuclease Cas6
MLFIALLMTLHTSSRREASSQEVSFVPLVRDVLEQVLSSSQERASRHQRPSYSIAHLSSQRELEILRLALWGERASENAATLISYLTCHPGLVSGMHHSTIQSVCLAPRPWTPLATWTDLMRPCTDRVVELRFLSPITFHGPTDTKGLDFPEPQAVFSQLLGRWNEMRGPALHSHLPSFLEQGGCVVADYHLHTRHLSCQDARHAGWVGWIRYRCRDPHPESIAAINSLSSLACFTGVGVATEHGMGLTRRISLKERGE